MYTCREIPGGVVRVYGGAGPQYTVMEHTNEKIQKFDPTETGHTYQEIEKFAPVTS